MQYIFIRIYNVYVHFFLLSNLVVDRCMLRSAFLNAVLKDVGEFSIQSLGSKSTRENIVWFLNSYFAPFPFNLTNKKLKIYSLLVQLVLKVTVPCRAYPFF